MPKRNFNVRAFMLNKNFFVRLNFYGGFLVVYFQGIAIRDETHSELFRCLFSVVGPKIARFPAKIASNTALLFLYSLRDNEIICLEYFRYNFYA